MFPLRILAPTIDIGADKGFLAGAFSSTVSEARSGCQEKGCLAEERPPGLGTTSRHSPINYHIASYVKGFDYT